MKILKGFPCALEQIAHRLAPTHEHSRLTPNRIEKSAPPLATIAWQQGVFRNLRAYHSHALGIFADG